MKRVFAILFVGALAACNQQNTSQQTTSSAGPKPVADPVAAAKTYYDGTNTAPWLALNKACKEEVAAGNRGVNCDAYKTASDGADKLIRANPSGFVGVRVKLN